MPVIAKPKLPEALDPETISESDPLYRVVLKRAMQALGVGDPASEAMGMVGPLPAVSMYANKAARMLGNERFLDKVSRLPRYMRKAFLDFANDYPRVAAHIEPSAPIFGPPKVGGQRPLAAVKTPGHLDKVSERIPLQISREGRKIFKQPIRAGQSEPYLRVGNEFLTPSRIIRHEGTHVAQRLGNKNESQLYTLAQEIWGYKNNPFEIMAREAENPAIGRLLRAHRQTNDPGNTAIRILRNRLASTPIEALNSRQVMAASEIERILAMREFIGNNAVTPYLP